MDQAKKYHISAQDFAEKYQLGELDNEQCVDVREAEEWAIYHLNQCKHIPLGTLASRLDELERDRPVYLLCAHGVRSLQAASFLLHQGFLQVVNVDGGLAEVSLYLDNPNI